MAKFLHNFVLGNRLCLLPYKNRTSMNKIVLLICFNILLLGVGNTQIEGDTTIVSTSEEIKIEDNATTLWKSGKSKYPPKPKNMWEVGLHGGHYFIDGDVDPLVPGFGFGVHLRKALNYVFSIRADIMYGWAFGLETQPYGSSLLPQQDVFRGYGPTNQWFPSYKTQYCYGVVEGVFNLGNILFHKDQNKWNLYTFIGTGLDMNKTKLDLRDANGNMYQNLIDDSGFSFAKFNTRQGRVDIKNALEGIYDGTYETAAPKKAGIFRFNDEQNVHVVFIGGMGVSRKLTKRLNLSLEHQVHVTDNDLLDGIQWRTDLDQTRQDDIQHYTNLRLGINLGRFKKRVEPLYWVNPLDAAYSDIAELKQRPKFDLTDTDQDGVIDMLDQETETPAGAPVDTRGVTLDSDNDGLADYKDEEPYSPPGYQVSEKGVAQIPVQPKLTEEDVKKLIEQKVATMPYGNVNGQSGTYPGGTTGGSTGGSTGGIGGGSNVPGGVYSAGSVDWFLPMIHFNLDEYCVKSQFAGQLHQVAQVMQMHPNLMVTAYGHTDARNNNNYNQVLSYNRAKAAIEYLVTKYNIPRERFKLMYGGEESPLGANHYINRRVEFRVSKAEDNDMARPEGPEAGDGCGKKKMKRSGNVKTDDGTDKDKKTGY
jgi:OOP family OmpA-OmpF porin